MSKILESISRYCKKLETATFTYFCTEEVKEQIMTIEGKKSKCFFLYDYQIVGFNGKLEETRTLIEKDRKKVTPEKGARIETEFYSFFTIYAPIRIFSKENRGGFDFVFMGEGKRKGLNYWIIKFEEKKTRGRRLSGEAWIVKKNFSILRIEFYPESMSGYEKLYENAKKIRATLQLSDIHWYEIEYNGLRFPSLTEFKESYQMTGSSPARIPTRNIFENWEFSSSLNTKWTWHRSVTSFVYKKYRFFSVKTSVEKEERVRD